MSKPNIWNCSWHTFFLSGWITFEFTTAAIAVSQAIFKSAAVVITL